MKLVVPRETRNADPRAQLEWLRERRQSGMADIDGNLRSEVH